MSYSDIYDLSIQAINEEKSRQPKWQHWTASRKRLWSLVMERFTEGEVSGRWQITLTREDLVRAGVVGEFDSQGNPLPAIGWKEGA